MNESEESSEAKGDNNSRLRSLSKFPSTSDSSPKLEELSDPSFKTFLPSKQISRLSLQNQEKEGSPLIDLCIKSSSSPPIQYCKLHLPQSYFNGAIKSGYPKNSQGSPQFDSKNKAAQKQQLITSQSGCSSLIESSENDSNGETSNDSSSESSQEEDIPQISPLQNKNIFEEQGYPLQLVCVESQCIEERKLCCAKCLRSGPHEGHEAICLKTLSKQIQMAMKTGGRLGQFSIPKVEQQFQAIISNLLECKKILLEQIHAAQDNLKEQSIKAIISGASLEQQVKVWKAFFQPEKSDLMSHINFISEKSSKLISLLKSRIQNLSPSKLLLIKNLSSQDLTFQNQLKAVEEELKRAENNLSSLAHHSIDVLPEFEFRNPELENLSAVAVKKFDYGERIEFSQINKSGEPQGRCLVFWNDGAFRVGYNVAGKSQGICRMVWENGNLYEGQYVNDRKEGQGSFVKFSDNSSYFGQFKHDQKSGQGVEYYCDNTYYIGSFKHWKKHGEGKLIDSVTKQIIKQGHWKNGKLINDQTRIE